MSTWTPKTPGELEAIRNLSTVSHREAALLAAIYVESRLDEELKARLRHDALAKKPLEETFHSSGPLGAFATKIRLGFLLRLYGARVYKELSIIKNIRNAFAHLIGEQAVLSFNEQPVKDWCSNLTLIEQYVRPMSEFMPSTDYDEVESWRRSGISYGTPGPELLADPKYRYTETCGLISSRFNGSGRFLILGDEPEPWP